MPPAVIDTPDASLTDADRGGSLQEKYPGGQQGEKTVRFIAELYCSCNGTGRAYGTCTWLLCCDAHKYNHALPI